MCFFLPSQSLATLPSLAIYSAYIYIFHYISMIMYMGTLREHTYIYISLYNYLSIYIYITLYATIDISIYIYK